MNQTDFGPSSKSARDASVAGFPWRWGVNHDVQTFVSSLLWTIQFVTALVLADLVESVIHRTLHEVKWLWPLHAVHHSVAAPTAERVMRG